MKEHKHTTWIEERPGGMRARCSCSWHSIIRETEDECRMHISLHLRDVKRAGQGGQPRLSTLRDYYLQMADDPATGAMDSKMWRVLADELTQRIGDSSPPDEEVQPGLF